MEKETEKLRRKELYCTTGKIAMEKLESIRSKMLDDTVTPDDRLLGELLAEIVGLAANRVSVSINEKALHEGKTVWVERTSLSHFPHVRLHGGALEDDPMA
ncbi:MAG: hypothetical protein HGA62_00785 [Chlorobiaceae bacterium]|nr:hypothetical protein [Chlorobiaceae bacterium]NTV61477.1 hypothetical protein [Chlorobiaceae bacterium]